ncbi:MAG: type II secretion system GspH family protein [Polyangiaceae bacterium]|nr:type II secretion system GspH family protein [Polyangiaceae bacterium]
MNRKLARTLARGVTLIEILIVLAIIGLIAGGVAVVAVPQLEKSRIKQAQIDARTIRPVAEQYRADYPGECPTMAQLVQKKMISDATKGTDPWDQQYKIICADDDIIVISAGPDKKENTADDIRIPELPAGGK